ncbi:hypothetical protein [Microbacterium hydrocarbonoxydans]|uniref:hypothetical protein n=1 Tax=Microbacterium hydrocarbonoxydans TaxID=273678 RepID=UPI00203F7995|nr:hypothetical protein [Microbacterium hydrocarbonoxydans]MCM3779856.1 hypothetical protein [Microbacterium hydrocarbonoxydans]
MKRTAAIVAASLLFLTGCSNSTAAPAPTVTVYETVPAAAEPTPVAPVETTAPAAPEPVVLTEEQRATMNTTFGAELGTDGPLGIYCPMDQSGRAYYADLVARQLDGFTEAMVLQYLAETC